MGNAKEVNTIQAYQDFMSTYPASEFTQEAKNSIENLDWKNTKQVNTIKAYQDFVRWNPESEFIKKAKYGIEKLEWENAKQVGTIQAYQDFMSTYPESEFTQDAKRSIEKLEWGKAKKVNTIQAYRDFISRHPKGKYIQEALNSVETLEWNNAKQVNTIQAYNDFLSRHPKGNFAKDAKSILETPKWEEAKQVGTIQAYKEFVGMFPESGFTQEAKNSIVKLWGNAKLIIPLEVDLPAFETQTKAEVFIIAGLEDTLIFSFDCKGCRGEVPLSGDSMVWTSGAEHIYAGKSVSKGYKYSSKSNKVEIGYKRLVIYVVNAGSFPGANKVKGWVIKGDPDVPLVFTVVKDLGYVYTGGRGVVIAPDGTTHNLGY